MPTSFLDLPRELRDVIYEHALISPTGYITLIADKSSRSPRFSIHTAFQPENKLITTNNDVLSLSLSRTCRQIYEETSGLFWSNAFLFPDLPKMTRILKAIGQIPSRQIKFIAVSLHARHSRTLPKAFALLSSRARHGCFQNLRLDLPEKESGDLIVWKCFNDNRYDEMLDVLRESSKECKFERRMHLQRAKHLPDVRPTFDETVRDLHLAFGGKMICNGRLEWSDYEHVGKHVDA